MKSSHRAAYEKLGDGVLSHAETQRAQSGMAALVADADVPFELPDGWAETAKRLDKKILDLAIHGKLVPQDPTDEPASELLKRIAAERKALVKAGKLKVSKCESVIFRGSHRPPHQNQRQSASLSVPFNPNHSALSPP